MQLPLLFLPFKNNAARRAPWALGAALGLCLGAVAPAAAQTVYGLTPTGLVNFEAGSPTTVSAVRPITGLTAGQILVGMDVRPATGELFALGYNAATTQAQVYKLDAASGAATPVGQAITLALGAATDRIGFDFNPTVDRIRVVSSNRTNFRLNPNTGALAVTDGTLTYATTDANAAQTPGVGAVAYTNSYIGTGATTLYGIDEINNRLVLQNPPNDGTLNTVGTAPLGIPTSGPTESADLDIYFNPTNKQNQAYLLVSSSTANQFYALDLTTGAATAPVTIGDGTLGITDIAIAIDRAVPATLTGQLLFATQTVGPNTNLLSFDSSNPTIIRSLVTITGLEAGQQLMGIDSRPSTGQLFGLGYNAAVATANARLYIIDPTTGVATPVGDAPMTLELGTATARVGFDFNPQVDRIRVVSTNAANYRLNPTNGTVVDRDPATAGTQRDGDLTTNESGIETPTISAAAYTNNFFGTGSTTLFVYDEAANQFFIQSPPNDGVLRAAGPVAGITVNRAAGVGFDIYSTRNNENLVLLAAAVGTTTNAQLYEVNISSGAASPFGNIGYGVPVNDIAFGTFAVTPVPTTPTTPVAGQLLYALTGGNLISFSSNTPRVIRTSVSLSLTSLAANQTLVGLDFRPANGDLFALGYNAEAVAPAPNAQLYTINPTLGTLTAVGAATRLELGATTDRIGFDFNPTVDRIRVVSTTGTNYRLNPNDGTLSFTDGALNPGTPSISAVAYTNSAPGPLAATTTLYDYDAATNQLFSQDPPNAGTLVAVGSSGITVNPTAGVDFDIYFDASATGDDQNKAFLVASEGTSINDNLYTVNLATGAATRVETIGSGFPVSGVTAFITATVLSNSKASAKLSAQVDVFPNPATNVVSINLPASLSKQNVEATLVNTLGQSVLHRTLSARDGSSQRLSLDGVAKGVYMLQLSTADGVVSKRLMVR